MSFTVVLVTLATLGCVTSAAAVAKIRASSPSDFRNDYDARMATADGGKSLWLGVVGTNSMGEYRIRVWKASGRAWTRLPGSLETPYGDGATYGDGLQLAAFQAAGAAGTTVCVGDSPREQGRIRCRTDAGWRELPTSPAADGVLVGLRSEPESMTALFASWHDGKTTVRAARSSGGPFEALGPPLELNGLIDAGLGTNTTGSPGGVDVGLQWTAGPLSGRQTVATLGASGWRLLPRQPGRYLEIQLSGPVRRGGVLTAPAIIPRPGGKYVRNWNFSVRRWANDRWFAVGGARLNRGNGANVGGVYAVGDEAWAAWSGMSRKDLSHAAERRVTIAELPGKSRRVRRKIEIYRGPDPGPTLLQVMGYRGQPAVLTNRAPKGRWRATVSVVRPKGAR